MFRLTPYILFGCMWLAAGIVPVLATSLPFAPAADIIALVAVFALARVFASLAAMDIGTSFGGLGARREMLIGFLAEPAMLMTLFTAAFISGSTQLTTIVETLAHRELAIYPSLAFAAVAFLMVLLAENARIPVDNPTTHLELTMVHEALILEYSARHLALVEWAAAIKLFAYMTIGFALFVPWGIAAGGRLGGAAVRRSPRCAVKLAVAGAGLALIETVLGEVSPVPRARVPLHRVPARGARHADPLPRAGLKMADSVAGQIVNLLAAFLLLVAFAMLSQRRVLSARSGCSRGRGPRSRPRPSSSPTPPAQPHLYCVGGDHHRAQSDPHPVGAAPADRPARRALGRRDADQHPDHDAGRDRARDLRVRARDADLRRWRARSPARTLGIALASVLLSFLMMIVRRKAMPQVIGFLAMENGLFFAATSATYGMPLVVELGVALDVLVGTFIFGIFFFHIREQFDSLDIRHMEKLKED